MADFLCVNNNDPGPNTVSVFQEDTRTGTLTLVGQPVATGGNGLGAPGWHGARTIAHSKGILWVSNPTSQTISVFKVALNGTLNLAGNPIPSGLLAGVETLAVAPNGKFLYVGGHGISGFRVAGAALTPISSSGSPLVSGVVFSCLAIDTQSKFLIASATWDQQIHVYQINYPQGFLVPVPGSPFAVPQEVFPTGLDVTGKVLPGRALLFVGSSHIPPDARFTLFFLDTLTGSLTQPLRVVFVGGARGASYVRARKDGRLLLVGHELTRNVSVLDVDPAAPPAGMLTVVAGSPFPVASQSPLTLLTGVELDRLNELVVMGNASIDIAGLRYGGQPRLQPAPGSPVATGDNNPFSGQNGLVFVRR